MRRIGILFLLLIIGMSVPFAAPMARAQSTVDTQVDVGLIIDSSGSMKQNDPRDMRFSAAKLFINLLTEGDQVGVVSLGDRDSTRTLLSLDRVTKYSALAQSAFGTTEDPNTPGYTAYTYMGEALDLSTKLMENAAQYNKQRAIILLTDGLPTYREEDKAAQEAKFNAAIEAFKRQNIKIFPIALGDGADPNFLQQQIAGPTNGEVIRATNASELLERYIEILERLQQGRYVDRYTVQSNVDTFLATTNPRQQMTQINFVFPEENGNVPKIDNIRLPRSVLADTGRLSQADDPNWVMWTAQPEYLAGFQGEWRILLQSPQPATPLFAVVKSDLRTQVAEPIPSVDGDDASVRYYPAGRPLLIRAGVRNKGDQLEKRIGLFAQMEQPIQLEGFTLADEGTAHDLGPVDGEYAGLVDQPLEPGIYRVRMSITPSENHIRLQKMYNIVVEPLPTMQASIEPQGPLEANEPARIVVRFALNGEPVRIDNATITAAVKRDDRVIQTIQLENTGDGTWTGDYTPPESGLFSFGLTAHTEWQPPDRSLRRYTDYLDVGFDASKQAAVEVDLSGGSADERVNSLRDGIQRTLQIRSVSETPIQLRLGVEGLPEGKVFPETVQIGPGEEIRRTITISSPSFLESGEYQTKLTIDAGENVEINTVELPVSFTVNTWLARNRVWIILLLLLSLLLVFRRVRSAIADFVVRNVELVWYGRR